MPSENIRAARLARFTLKALAFLVVVAACLFVANADARGQEPQAPPIARLISTTKTSESDSRPQPILTGLNRSGAPKPTLSKAFPSLSDATPIERRAFEMTNSLRLANGLAALNWDPDLCRMARTHSENMARLGFFAHVTPEGSRLKDRARAAGITHFRVIAENIAYNQGSDDPGAFAVERWMISSGHRDNLLSREFRSAAIGVFVDSEGSVYLSQIFILR